jgi:hypothetical protein
VTNAVTALVVVAGLAPLVVSARLVVQYRRGTLDWDREVPVIVSLPLWILGLEAIVVGGPFATLIVPPCVIVGCGIALRYYAGQPSADPSSSARMRRLSALSLVGGIGGLGAALLRLWLT